MPTARTRTGKLLACGIRVAGLLFTAYLLASCEADRQLLNSERIQQQFGSYGVEVLYADDSRRVSNLYSDETASGKVCRTFAIVEFTVPVDQRIRDLHRRIVAGQSIGQVFVDAGWKVSKQNLFIGESGVSDYEFRLDELMHIGAQQALATHRYRFMVKLGTRQIEYATITEVHHPDYLDSDQLQSIYK